MKISSKYSFLSMLGILFAAGSACAQFDHDYFWSQQPLDGGAVNDSLVVDAQVGEKVRLYLYYTTNGPADVEVVDLVCGLNIATTQNDIIRFESAESFDFDIVLTSDIAIDLGNRWIDDQEGGFAGPALEVTDDIVESLVAFTNFGSGMRESNNGSSVFLDLGYDQGADAFLFGAVEFCALSPGTTEFIQETSKLGCVDPNGIAYDPVNASVSINVSSGVVLGDVNLDGSIDLLDVAPFVDILATMGFQAEADINGDGVITLLDVPLFVALLAGP